MHSYELWSPSATEVDVLVHDGDAEPRRVPMTRADGGWWRADDRASGPGTDYAFSVDSGAPTPDPRSAWQPNGVHEASRLFDAGAYTWKDDDWAGLDLGGRVLYELHVGTFTPEGTLDAARKQLDHLVELGVDAVELMPVAAFPGKWGWGYDGVALYAVHAQYGGPAALQKFVDACHQRGLAVVLDVVYNHLGPSGNYLQHYGPYFTDTHHTPWGMAVNLDAADNEPVRRFIVDNALRWFRDFHVDGLRLDAVHELRDDSDTHILTQLSDETASAAADLGRPLTLIAESDLNDAVMVTPTAEGGRGMTAQWDDDVHHALHTLLTDERQGYYADFGTIETLAKTLTDVFHHNGTFSSFRGREWGAKVDVTKVSGHAFVTYTTTHDQTGNRAVGDRLSATLSAQRQAVAAALVLTSAYTPMLFMGEEFAASSPWQYFTDHAEPELAQAIREGRRAEFAAHGWAAAEVPDPQDVGTRDGSVLDLAEARTPDGARLLAWYRALIALRRREPDLSDGDLSRVTVDFDEERRWLVVHRGSYRVVVNLAEESRTIRLDRAPQHVALTFDGARLTPNGVRLGPDGVAVVAVDATPTVVDAVRDYLRRTVTELDDAVARDDVHDMRVSCRRVRSILRAHGRALQPQDKEASIELADRAREIARALSDDRDHEVAGEVIEDWAAEEGWPDADRDAILAALYPSGAVATKPAGQQASSAADALDARAAARDLAADVHEFLAQAHWRGRAQVPARGGLAGYRSRAHGRIVQRFAAAQSTHPADDPHELWHLVRKAAKRLRYTAEAGQAVRDDGAGEVMSAAKQVQTVIGDLQDARLVRDRLAQVPASAPVARAIEKADATIADRAERIDPALARLREATS